MDSQSVKFLREAWGHHRGGCQNYDPFSGPLNIRCHIIIGIQKGTIILTATQMNTEVLLNSAVVGKT